METTAYRYLAKEPGVRGNRMIIANTRVGVHEVMGLILSGASVEDAQRRFPALTKEQIYECLAWYIDHHAEIDALIAQQPGEKGAGNLTPSR